MNRRGMSLVEMMMATLLCGMFFMGLYRLQASMNRTTEYVRWKTQSQDTIRKFYKNFLIPDINKATYISEVTEESTKIATPTPGDKFQYNNTGTPDPKDPLAKIIKFDSISDGLVLMKWQICSPTVNVNSNVANTGVGPTHADSQQPVLAQCYVRAYKTFNETSPSGGRKIRRNVITYERVTNAAYPVAMSEMKPIAEKAMLESVEYIKLSDSPRYTKAEIDAMNVVPNSITPATPNGKPLSELDPDYFHYWNNSGSINIEIGLIQDRRVTVLLTGTHRFVTQEKVSIKTNVEIVGASTVQ